MDLKQRLEKKSTFEPALRELSTLLRAGAQPADACPPEELLRLLPLVARVHVLLKTRYSNVSFWKQGQQLFEACRAHPSLPPAAAAKLEAQIAEARSFSQADDDAADEAPASTPTLGELLFGIPPPQPAPSHLSDAGLVLADPAPRPAAAPAAAPAAPAAPAAAAGGDDDVASHRQPADGSGGTADAAHASTAAVSSEAQLVQTLLGLLPPEQLEQLTQQQQQQQQQQQRAGSGHQVSMLELLEADRLAALLSEAAPAAPPRPPAAKAAVASLPTTTVAPGEAAAGSRCPVCTEELAPGDAVQRLPCAHLFHPGCLAPWLARDNSCPCCRAELPTDDWRYEARKEREAQEAEDRRGAENALSHNEFMYV